MKFEKGTNRDMLKKGKTGMCTKVLAEYQVWTGDIFITSEISCHCSTPALMNLLQIFNTISIPYLEIITSLILITRNIYYILSCSVGQGRNIMMMIWIIIYNSYINISKRDNGTYKGRNLSFPFDPFSWIMWVLQAILAFLQALIGSRGGSQKM